MNWDTLQVTYPPSAASAEMAFSGTGGTDWGFAQDVKGTRKQQAPDEFTVTLPSVLIAAEAAAPTFPFECQIIVRTNRASATGAPGSFSGGTVKFQGKRVGQPLKASPSGQGATYKFQGPWYDLANTHYQQTFVGNSGNASLCAETALNTSTAVTSGQLQCSAGDQIQAVLQWLLDQYSQQGLPLPFQYKGRLLATAAGPLSPGGGKAYIDLDGHWTTGSSMLNYVYNYGLDPSPTISAALFSVYYPSYITKPLMCAEAILKELELLPRACAWFDHTTVPPTFHVTVPADKRSVTLPLFDLASHKGLSIQRRDDLFVRAVNILYRISSTYNGSPVVGYVQDQWGPHGSNSYYAVYNAAIAGGATTAAAQATANAAVAAGTADPVTGLRVVNELIDLQGFSETTSTAHVDTEPVLATAAEGGTTQALKRGWWASNRGGHIGELLDARVRFQDCKNAYAQTYIPDATITAAAAIPSLGIPAGGTVTDAQLFALGFCDKNGNLVVNKVVSGATTAWMVRPDGQPVVTLKVRLTASMKYVTYDTVSTAPVPDADTSGQPQKKPNAKDQHANFQITNATTGSYTTVASATGGESYIVGAGGIAQYLYQHLAAYQYDGDACHVAAAFADSTAVTYVDPGCALNLSGGAPEWLAMGAQVQAVDEDYSKHETTVRIGVAKHLNAGQLSSILNMWRFRRPWYNPLLRSNAALQNGGAVDQSNATGDADSLGGVEANGAVAGVDYAVLPSGSTPGTVNSTATTDPAHVTAAEGLN